jgi:hypothetical protein
MKAAGRVMVAGVLAIGAWTPSGVWAQQKCGRELRMPVVGGWAEWKAVRGSARFALVDSERKGTETLYRLELSGGGENGGVMQVVVPEFPFQMDAAQELVMMRPGSPPVKMSGQMLEMMKANIRQHPNLTMDLMSRCASLVVVGAESVTVPAGTFKTRHLKDATTGDEVWVSERVPFGVVKHVGKGTGETVLVATGTGAKTAITETPIEMPPGMMGPPRN